jgi:hypothetical protein
MPKVLNCTHGARPGPDCVYIGGFHREPGLLLVPSAWRNPFRVPLDGDRDEVCVLFEEWLLGRRPGPPGHRVKPARLREWLPELRGKDLLCSCAPERCHGEVLLRLANG